MRYCEKCKVSVNNPLEHCPLCFATLSVYDDAIEVCTYPDYQGKAKHYNLILRILLMLSLSAGSICVIINLLIDRSFLWSLIVVASIAYMWVCISTVLRKHVTLGFKVLVQVSGLTLLVILVDLLVGDYDIWAYDYILPALFFAASLLITILIIVKRVKFREFILYAVLIALLGFVPVILLAAGLVRVAWPSMALAVYAGLSLVSLFVFADTATKIELKKRFHI